MKAGWRPHIEESRADGAARLLAQLRRCPTPSQAAAMEAVEAWADGGDETPAIEAVRKVVAECMAAGGEDLRGAPLRQLVCDVFDDVPVKSDAEAAFE